MRFLLHQYEKTYTEEWKRWEKYIKNHVINANIFCWIYGTKKRKNIVKFKKLDIMMNINNARDETFSCCSIWIKFNITVHLSSCEIEKENIMSFVQIKFKALNKKKTHNFRLFEQNQRNFYIFSLFWRILNLKHRSKTS
jgi:hypothetical protein